jgi:lipoprotein-anchoring transpeptidase ErfK/SrfK
VSVKHCAVGAAVALAAAALVLVPASARATPAHRCATSSRWLASWSHTFAGRVRKPLTAYRQPGAMPFMRLSTADAYGFPTTLSVLERFRRCGVSWYRVRLPARPNGVVGWVLSKEVKTTRLSARILVDLSRHRLFFYRHGRIVLRSPVAIGKQSTPTPRGRFYVTQRFIVTTPGGPYGPRALGISAFSDVLRSWRDGGPIGIHGTNEPFSIGEPVSHGCIRMPNPMIVRLFKLTPLGTPVVIRA